MAAVPAPIHALLAAQHGHVSRAQLRAELTANQIQHLVRRGDLVDAGLNAYRSPSVGASEAGWCASLCLGRPGVTISGPAAGRLWGFRKMGADQRIHVLMEPHANSVSRNTLPGQVAVVATRTSLLRPVDVVDRGDGIRVTTRERTCLDLALSLRPDPLLSVIEQALHDGGADETAMLDVAIAVGSHHRGRRRFVDQLDRRIAGAPAESDGEVRLGDALVAHGLDGIVRQYRLAVAGFGTMRFDLAVPELRWAVELDLFPTHEQTVGAGADRRRDDAASSAGWTVRRVGREQYVQHFHRTVAELITDATRRRMRAAGGALRRSDDHHSVRCQDPGIRSSHHIPEPGELRGPRRPANSPHRGGR